MQYRIMTLFPQMFPGIMDASILGRAKESGLIGWKTFDIREYTRDKHKRVDDYPYGGGAGMVMQAEPVYRCYEAVTRELGHTPKRVIYMTPQGRVFDQKMAEEFAKEEELVFLCGHYEGIDERVLEEIVTDAVSVGDYVMTGGELPAMAVMDAVSRLVPGVLNNEDSARNESFSDGLLEYPQYCFPDITRRLRSGGGKNRWSGRGNTDPICMRSGKKKSLYDLHFRRVHDKIIR